MLAPTAAAPSAPETQAAAPSAAAGALAEAGPWLPEMDARTLKLRIQGGEEEQHQNSNDDHIFMMAMLFNKDNSNHEVPETCQPQRHSAESL